MCPVVMCVLRKNVIYYKLNGKSEVQPRIYHEGPETE